MSLQEVTDERQLFELLDKHVTCIVCNQEAYDALLNHLRDDVVTDSKGCVSIAGYRIYTAYDCEERHRELLRANEVPLILKL